MPNAGPSAPRDYLEGTFDPFALSIHASSLPHLWILRHDVKDFQFFLTFIIVAVPFVMLVCFGLAVINYDVIAGRSGWPLVLPLDSPLSPLLVGPAAFYIGQTMWLWWDWRKLRMPR
jgi:hypothetical protein